MLVIVLGDQLVPPEQVCRNCMLATQQGQPRWRNGALACGHRLARSAPQAAERYECQMGFRLMKVGAMSGEPIIMEAN